MHVCSRILHDRVDIALRDSMYVCMYAYENICVCTVCMFLYMYLCIYSRRVCMHAHGDIFFLGLTYWSMINIKRKELPFKAHFLVPTYLDIYRPLNWHIQPFIPIWSLGFSMFRFWHGDTHTLHTFARAQHTYTHTHTCTRTHICFTHLNESCHTYEWVSCHSFE